MEPRNDEHEKDRRDPRELEKQRPRFQPRLERLEERISPSGMWWMHWNGHGGHGLGQFA